MKLQRQRSCGLGEVPCSSELSHRICENLSGRGQGVCTPYAPGGTDLLSELLMLVAQTSKAKEVC